PRCRRLTPVRRGARPHCRDRRQGTEGSRPMMFTLDMALKASLVGAAALAATALLRAQSAAVRHWILTVSVVCVAALPLLSLIVPTWQIPVAARPAPATDRSASTISVAIMPQSGAALEMPAPVKQIAAEPRDASQWPARFWLVPVWLSGAAVSGLMLIVGLI